MDHTHKFKWINTSIGGFAECTGEDWGSEGHPEERYCGILDTEIKESDCVGYVTPGQVAETEKKRKEKRLQERETKRLATIEYLKKKKQ